MNSTDFRRDLGEESPSSIVEKNRGCESIVLRGTPKNVIIENT